MLNVVLIGNIAALGREMIERGLRCDVRFTVISNTAEAGRWSERVAEAEVLVGWPLTPEIVRTARRVRLIQAAGAGVDGVPFDLLPPGVIVANTFHHETSIAEHILMAMLWLTRRPDEYDRRLREGNWWGSCIWGETPRLGVLDGKTALLIGLGHIAREVARRTRAFGVRNVAVSRAPRGEAPDIDERVGYDRWEERLSEADFVIPCCPLTPRTEGLIGAPQFDRMKPSASLINTARGRVVDETALFEALRSGRIAGAAIDVWYDYPRDPAERRLPSRCPFHELPNVLMTPHVSGWTLGTVEGRMRDIAENLSRLDEGRPLLNVVYQAPRG